MTTDVLFVAWNRREFTEFSFAMLLANTAWDAVDRLIVYDDGSEDGTLEYLQGAVEAARNVVDIELRQTNLNSPPAIMNHYLDRTHADWFAKIDNDIVVPAGWLQAMLAVIEEGGHPPIDLLGMELGHPLNRPCGEPVPADEPHWFTESSHIGGVGLMRVDAFRRRSRIPARGRFGFTHWQWKQNPRRGWITPDIAVCQLDRVPAEPWASLSEQYRERGWQRAVSWPQHDPVCAAHYWADWPVPDHEEAAA